MKRHLLVACILSVLAVPCLADEAARQKAALERGQKYLDKVAKTWKEKLPAPVLLATYQNEKFVGHVKQSVTAAGDGFQVDGEAELERPDGKKTVSHYKMMLSANLNVTSVESVVDNPEGQLKFTVAVSGGKWTITFDQGGKKTTKDGDVTPATIWGPTYLPLFALPEDDEVALTVPDLTTPLFTIKKLKNMGAKLTIGGKVIDCTVIEEQQGGVKKRVLLGPDGAVVEVQNSGTTIHMRPATEADLGKDIPGQAPPADPGGGDKK